MFSYHFNPRSQWIFDSPNHFATVLGMSLLLVGGFLAWLLQQHRFSIRRLLALSCATALLGGLSLSLVRTYSRGGWIAFLAGVCVFLGSLHQWRRVPLLLIAIFLTLLLLVPDAADRSNPNAFGADRSVGNRILVWKGALAMTAAHWVSGVGDGRFGDEFTAWFQPVPMKTRYRSAINNYLTLSVERGIFALWGYLCLVLGVLWVAWLRAQRFQNPLALGAVSAQAVYLVSGLFTYCLTIWEVAWLFWALFAISAWQVFKETQRTWKMRWGLTDSTTERFVSKMNSVKFADAGKTLFRAFAPPLSASTVICLWILIGGFRLRADLPTRAELFTFDKTGQHQPGVIVRPAQVAAKGVILWNHGKGGNIHEDGKDTLRYLAEKGFIVVSVDYRDNGMDGLEDVRALAKWIARQTEFESYPIGLAGFSLGARLSILTACYDPTPRLKAVASIGAAAEWPMPEISPLEHLYELKCPLLIVHGEADHVNSVDQAHEFERLCKRYRKPYEIFIVRGGSHHLNEDDQWFTALDRIAEFMKKHLAVASPGHFQGR